MSFYIGFNTPVPFEFLETWMLVEEAAVPAAHVSVADHPSLTNANSSKILQAIHKSSFVDPIGKRPMVIRDHFIVALRGCKILRSGLARGKCVSLLRCDSKHTLNSSLNGSSLKKIHG